MPALELRMSSFDVLVGDRIQVPCVAGDAGCVVFLDAIEVVRLVAFGYEADVGGGRDANDFSFLRKKGSLVDLGFLVLVEGRIY